jgi:hypothetical protein
MGKKNAKKTKSTGKAKNDNKKGQLRIAGTERPNRIEEIDEAAEAYRVARNERQAAGKVEQEKKAVLKDLLKKHGIVDAYFYDDEEGDTEEVKPISEVKEDVKVNKVKNAKAKDEE